MNRGIPVLSSNCQGPIDIIEPGVNGYLYQLHHIDDLVAKLKRCIEINQNWNQQTIKDSISYLSLDKYVKNFELALGRSQKNR